MLIAVCGLCVKLEVSCIVEELIGSYEGFCSIDLALVNGRC
jgi:hypothetical protein